MKETTAGTVVLVLAMALSLGGFLSVVITKLESRDAAKLTGIFLALAAMAIAVIAVLKPNTHTFGALLWFFGFSMALGFVIFLFLFIFLWAKDHVIKKRNERRV